MTDVVLALDISAAGLGMVSGPIDWRLSWSHLRFESLEVKLLKATPGERLDLILQMADDVAKWASHYHVTRVWAEAVPVFGWNTILLGKIRAAIDFELHRRLHLLVDDAEQSTMRKHLLGYLPPGNPKPKKGQPRVPRDPSKDRKLVVCNALRACGDPFADNDQRDAFTVFNFACHKLGGHSLQSLLGEKPKPPPKPRKRKAGALALPGVG